MFEKQIFAGLCSLLGIGISELLVHSARRERRKRSELKARGEIVLGRVESLRGIGKYGGTHTQALIRYSGSDGQSYLKREAWVKGEKSIEGIKVGDAIELLVDPIDSRIAVLKGARAPEILPDWVFRGIGALICALSFALLWFI